jgi:signal transduction histidine kinase
VLVLACGALSWRRQTPRAVLAVVVAVWLAALPAVAEPVLTTPLAVVVAAYTVGAHCARRPAVTSVGIAVGATALHALAMASLPAPPLVGAADAGTTVVPAALATGLALVAACHFGMRVAGQREARARQAVLAERDRIARELHDAAAHHLSAVVVQTGAAERHVDRNPDAARQALADIRQQGRATLAELRELVGALRADGVGADERATTTGSPRQPTLDECGELVRQARNAGCEVTFAVEGEPAEDVPPAVALVAYRVLQEALSNARRHAAGQPVTARLRHAPAAVEVVVENPLPTPSTPPPSVGGEGVGLAGMGERVAHVGGRLIAGATRDERTWRVRAVLPVAAEHRHGPQQPASAATPG